MIASRMKLYEFLYNVWENKGSPFQLPSIQWVPMQYPFVEWGSHTTFDEVITGNQSTIPCPTYNNTIAIIDRALCI